MNTLDGHSVNTLSTSVSNIWSPDSQSISLISQSVGDQSIGDQSIDETTISANATTANDFSVPINHTNTTASSIAPDGMQTILNTTSQIA